MNVTERDLLSEWQLAGERHVEVKRAGFVEQGVDFGCRQLLAAERRRLSRPVIAETGLLHSMDGVTIAGAEPPRLSSEVQLWSIFLKSGTGNL